MRAVIQRVLSASVTVDGALVSSIRHGLVVLVGLSRTDTHHDLKYMANKLLNLKIFDTPVTATAAMPSTARPWSQSAASLQLDVLLVSQFTLYAELKGNRLDFHTAMPPAEARPLYERFVAMVRAEYGAAGGERVRDGVFGADMKVELVNDGPVTVTLETREKQFEKELAKESRPFGAANKQSGRGTQQRADATASTEGDSNVQLVGGSAASSEHS